MATDGDSSGVPGDADLPLPRLEVLKTLGDNTRYAIYLELARSPRPRSTAEVAGVLDLHPNTVRPHLERMRDLGLVEVTAPITGAVGRPQHRYALASDAPSLGLEPPVFPILAGLLLDAASAAGLTADDVEGAARVRGAADRRDPGSAPIEALEGWLAELGFDPTSVEDEPVDGRVPVRVAFGHCPFRSLAESHPELVCGAHRGMVEGFVAGGDVSVVAFHSIAARTPCQVDLSRGTDDVDAVTAG